MPPRYFTPEEADEALAFVRPLTEELVRRHQALTAAQQRRAALAEQIAGNGGGIQPSELAEATEELEEAATAVARCLEEINALGGQVKDLDEGSSTSPPFAATKRCSSAGSSARTRSATGTALTRASPAASRSRSEAPTWRRRYQDVSATDTSV